MGGGASREAYQNLFLQTTYSNELNMSNLDCVATMLRYPNLMFTFDGEKYSGAIPLSRTLGSLDNIRSAVSITNAIAWGKPSWMANGDNIKVGSDVQHGIFKLDTPYLGVSTKGGLLLNRNREPANLENFGANDMEGIAKKLNQCYNEEKYGNNSLPPFIVIIIPNNTLPDENLLEFRFDDDDSGGDYDWSAFQVNFKIPGYVCVGDFISFQNNGANRQVDGDENWARRHIPLLTPFLLFARQEICLVGNGRAITKDMGRQVVNNNRILYMHDTSNPYYQPFGVFTRPKNNVSVLRCAFEEAGWFGTFQLRGDEGDIDLNRLTETTIRNGNWINATHSLKPIKYFEQIMHRFIENGLTHMKRLRKAPSSPEIYYPFGWYSFIDSFPRDAQGGVSDVKAFFTALCNDDARIAGRPTLCNCIKPLDQRTAEEQAAQKLDKTKSYKTTLDIFRDTLGLTDKPLEVVSFACNTKACIDSDPNTTIRFSDPCPATKPRLCIFDIKLDKPGDILTNVCYNCNDAFSQCDPQVPTVLESLDGEPIVCGINADGTEIYCATSDAVRQFVEAITLAATVAATAAAEAESAKKAAIASTATAATAKTASDAAAAAAARAVTAATTATTAWTNAKQQALTLIGMEKTTANTLIENGTFKESAARASSDAAAASASAALAAYTALGTGGGSGTTTGGPSVIAPPTVVGIASVQFYTTKITTLKIDVAGATLDVESEKAKATAATATLTIALSAKNKSLLTVVTATDGAVASAAALSSAIAEKAKLTVAADISAAATLIATATVDNQVIQADAAKASSAMLAISAAYDALQASFNELDAIPTQAIQTQIDRLAVAKESASQANASALRAKNEALAAKTKAAADAAVQTATEAAAAASAALVVATTAQNAAIATNESMRVGEAKTAASALIATAAIEIDAIQKLVASAESAKNAAQAAALALSDGTAPPGEGGEDTPPGEGGKDTPPGEGQGEGLPPGEGEGDPGETPPDTAGKNVGMIAGIAVGVVLVFVIIAVLVYVFVIRKRVKKETTTTSKA